MRAYVNVSYNHFLAISRWATDTGAEATLDLRDFTMEVKCRGRYYRMYPLFQARVGERQVHVPHLAPEVRGFGGWRPYQTFTHPHSTDKQLFKDLLRHAGLLCPPTFDIARLPGDHDFILKARSGSFGRGLYGPYRAGTRAQVSEADRAEHGDFFAEQFVPGRMLKVWYWGSRPFFAHVQAYPEIVGDGRSCVETLVRDRFAAVNLSWASSEQRQTVLDCLAFQGIAPQDVLAPGQKAWMDFRYGQLYATVFGGTSASDNQLEALEQAAGDQVRQLGQTLEQLLQETIPLPIVATVDGVLDEAGRVWWLEMNTNSVLPPEAYATMFADLFA